MIKLRIDVDYPYPSRYKSFLYTALNIKKTKRKDYLKNSRILAKMINESQKEIRACWFFTPYTIPDDELLDLLKNDKHEVGLHVINHPYEELKQLEQATKKSIRYYTIHGTSRLFAKLIWKRKLWQARAQIPQEFPLKSLHDFKTLSFDALCYEIGNNKAAEIAEKRIAEGWILTIHPEWLFQRGTMNHRGPYYEALKKILNVDNDLAKTIMIKTPFFTLAKNASEYLKDINPNEEFLTKLSERKVDIFSFIERGWLPQTMNQPKWWTKEQDNVGLLHINSYEKWLKAVVKKTRHNMVRKAEKFGVTTEIFSAINDTLAKDIWKIYNETPIRQNRAFPHYGISVESLKNMLQGENCIIVVAYSNNEVVGIAQVILGYKVAILSQLLSLQKYWNKAINNALIAKAVEICEKNRVNWLIYGRMETAHPSLDSFKRHNGFTKFSLTRFYIPLTRKGRLALRLRLHKDLKDVLPKSIKYPLIPVYSWISRMKIKLGLRESLK
jgi:hypothetical protein